MAAVSLTGEELAAARRATMPAASAPTWPSVEALRRMSDAYEACERATWASLLRVGLDLSVASAERRNANDPRT